jgi:hypothetical protein
MAAAPCSLLAVSFHLVHFASNLPNPSVQSFALRCILLFL